MTRAPLVTRMPEGLLRHADGRVLRLLGPGSDQAVYAELLERAGFRAAEGDDPASTVPPDEAPRLLCIPSAAPAATVTEAFSSLAGHLPAETDLLHPAAIAGWCGLSAHHRFAVTGYTGFGNMLLQAVLREIDAVLHLHAPQRSAVTHDLHNLTEHHSAVLRRISETLLAEIARDTGTELRDYVVAPGWLADCTVRGRFTDGETLILGGLPYAGFFDADFGAHTFWNDRVAAFFPRYGYRRVYLAMRNPLAGTASNAAKTIRPLERVLHDEVWFRAIARETARYLEAAHAHRDAFRIVRFEDLLQQPRAVIQRLARDAGRELADVQADAVWARIGFKPVTPAGPEHLFDPTADKRRHFRPRHLEIMAEEGLLDASRCFDYEPPTPDDLPRGDLAPQPDAEVTVPSTLYGRLDPTRATERRDEALGIVVRATDAVLADAALDRLRGAGPRRFLRSLGDTFTGGVRCPPDLVS